MSPRPSQGWLFLSPDAVPANWRERAVPLMLVPLLPEETDQVLAGEPVVQEIQGRDRDLLRLVARGRSAPEIAEALGLSVRSVNRRLAGLRRRFGVETTSELAAFLSRKGF